MDNLVVSVSHSTRQCREGERNGVDYHFIDKQLFSDMIENDSFLEHAEVFGHWYGTSRVWVAEHLATATM